MLPKVVIVGRPNVGKSSLLNILAARRISIVDSVPGVTRDRVSATMQLPPTQIDQSEIQQIELVDTGGYGIGDGDELSAQIEYQIACAVDEAHLILFVVDAQAGILPLDQQVARLLRASSGRTPVLLVANKVDCATHEPAALEATRLGFGTPAMVSATSRYGRANLVQTIRESIDWEAIRRGPGPAADHEAVVQVAVVGKRNAGKSTLVNALAGSQRVIVSEQPGTTRDAIDVRLQIDQRVFTVIDTAGVRRRNSLASDVEFYSQHRALRSIRRADVVSLLIDAAVPISQVDQQLSSQILRHNKPCIVVVNKWDLAEENYTQQQYVEYLGETLKGLGFAPVAFISAVRGEGMRQFLAMALNLYRQASCRVPTAELNSLVQRLMAEHSPRSRRGHSAKVYYATQMGVCPPTVGLWVNRPDLFDGTYRRFLVNQLREVLPFSEVPIQLLIKGK